MLKQILLILLFSLIAVFFKSFLAQGVHGLLHLQSHLNSWLSVVTFHGSAGRIIHATLLLFILPLVCGLLAWLIFRFVRGHNHYFPAVVAWVVWLISLVVMLSRV